MTNQSPRNIRILLGSAGVIAAGIIGTSAYLIGTSQSATQKTGNSNIAIVQTNASPTEIDLKIKGNRKSRIYHLQGCPNYGDIGDQNIVWFKTVEEAKARGFRPARNC